MLKVVGASWLQTRISTYILVAMLILAIVALFVGDLERVQDDGTFSSTVFWSRKTGFNVESWGQGNDLLSIPRGAARAAYRADNSKTGWAILEIETNPIQPDWVQAYSAGLLEGTLSWQAIYFHWNNVVKSFCDLEENIEWCDDIRALVKQNADAVRGVAKLRSSEPFWHQVSLFYDQLDGLEYGFRHGVRRSRQTHEIPTEDFLLMNNPRLLLSEDDVTPGNRSLLLVKLLGNINNESLLVGHSTDGSYNAMLRILKRYRFGYHTTIDAKQLIPSAVSVFSGYPGALSSHDELYLVSGNTTKMIIAGTTLKTDGIKNQETLDYVPQAPRVMAANRLSHGGRTWSKYFIRSSQGATPYNEGTQWIIADLTRLRQTESENDENDEHDNDGNVSDLRILNDDVTTDTNHFITENKDFDHIMFETGNLWNNRKELATSRSKIINTNVENFERKDNGVIVSVDKENLGLQIPLKTEFIDSEVNEGSISENIQYLRNVITEEQPRNVRPDTGRYIRHGGKSKGLLWLVETTSEVTRAADVSMGFRMMKYWTNGIPYFKNIIESSTVPSSNLEWLENVLHHQKNITNVERISALFHENAVRDDISNASRNSGNIDIKVVLATVGNGSVDGVMDFQLTAGPTFTSHVNLKSEDVVQSGIKNSGDNILDRNLINKGNVALMTIKRNRQAISKANKVYKPFNWSETKIKDKAHNGHPDLWNFGPISPSWAWVI